MKKVFLFILIIGLVATVVGFAASDGDFQSFFESLSYDKDYTFDEVQDTNEVTEIRINSENANVIFNAYEGEGYKVDYYESDYDKKVISYLDGLLTITQKREWTFKIFNFSFNSYKLHTINVYIPETFIGKLIVNSTSGNVVIDHFDFTIMNITLTSGNVELSNIKTEKLGIDITSGNTDIKDSEIDTLDISQTSGNTTLKNVLVNGNVDLHSISGNINMFDSTMEDLIVNVTSGNVNLTDVDLENFDCNVTSGNVKIKLTRDVETYKLDISTTSGDVYFKGTKINGGLTNLSGTGLLKVRTTSGDVRLLA